jgi:curved DNA-binding protein CbpA
LNRTSVYRRRNRLTDVVDAERTTYVRFRPKMANPGHDPYRTLGVRAGISDEELRKTYRRLVQQHHPDHNGGSAESARRFEEIQEAYAQIKRARGAQPHGQPGQPRSDPGVEARLADLERELREAQAARERAARAEREARAARNRAAQAAREAAREAATPEDLRRASNEDLGYVTTDDSFTQILADARAELSDQLSEGFTRAREHPVARRVSDLIDELEDLASRGDRESRSHRKP